MYCVPPNEIFNSGIEYIFSRNFWEECSPAAHMGVLSLEGWMVFDRNELWLEELMQIGEIAQ
jgi:hypothetical protein